MSRKHGKSPKVAQEAQTAGGAVASAGLISKISAVVDGAGKDALSRRLDQSHAVRRSEAIGGPTHERLDPRHLRVAQAVQLRQLDDPNAAGLHGRVFAPEVRQFISEELAGECFQRGRFTDSLRPFENETTIRLGAWPEDSRNGGDQPTRPNRSRVLGVLDSKI